LVLVVHNLAKLGTTDLTKHLGENLRNVALCCSSVAFFAVFLTLRLEILEIVRREEERISIGNGRNKGEGKGGRSSTDNTTRWDCSGEVDSGRKYMDKPPSSIALII
jgi:hypothetical protein